MITKYKIIASPVGDLKIVTDDKALLAILWDKEKLNRVNLSQMIEDKNHDVILEAEKQLDEYFHGQRKYFSLPIKTSGTLFQTQVWDQLTQIPYGATWTYQDIAKKINRPKAVRAVGTAIGKNPISIMVPCHRVIGSNGSLTGFAGGIDRKKTLLDLELTKP